MSFEITKAMVLAAGRGTRMQSLTDDLPKPLIRVAGKCLMDYVFDHIETQGLRDVVVNVCYLGDKIRSHCASRRSVRFSFSEEDEALETGGGVKKALPLLNAESFFVINSDPLWTDGSIPALERLARAWNPDTMDALLLLVPTSRAFGHDGTGDYFIENGFPVRKTDAAAGAAYVFGGVQILKASLFDDAPDGKFRLVSLYDKAQAAKRLACVVHDADWFHVGTPDARLTAERKLGKRG